jgi:hypothetical protein
MITRATSVAFCLTQLCLARLALRAFGFGWTLAHFERPVLPVARPMAADDSLIDRVAHTVTAAAVLYPGRARCLEQSLVLSRELRRLGAAARLRFGVHPYPFGAHAWVEVEGRTINEDADYMKMFTRLED